MKTCLALILCLFASSPAFSDEPLYEDSISPERPLLAVLGDSLSTGVLANTQLGTTVTWDLWSQVLRLLFSEWSNPAVLHRTLSNPDLAAATTRSDYGIRTTLGHTAVISFAKFGARAKHLPEMLDRLHERETWDLPRKADHIFLMVGGNDYCSDTTVEEFRADYTALLQKIAATHPATPLIVAPIPPVEQLQDLRTTPMRVSLRDGRERLVTCEQFQMESCANIFEVNALQRRLEMNQVIQDSLAGMQHQQLTFVEGILGWTILPEEVATDCFHPSVKGQETLGRYLKQALVAADPGTVVQVQR